VLQLGDLPAWREAVDKLGELSGADVAGGLVQIQEALVGLMRNAHQGV
jgi:hypothetical protein